MIDSLERALKLRKTLKKGNEVLVADLSKTLQKKDTTKVIELMPNVATGEYVFRTKVNIKEIDPIASKAYRKEFWDIRNKTDKEIENFLKIQEFDFPLWFKHNSDFKHQEALDYNGPAILQLAGCNFHDGTKTGGCTYCFVDNVSNDGIVTEGKAYISVEETIDSMEHAREKIKPMYAEHGFDTAPRVLRVSGGEPTIVLDWILDLWREVTERGLNYVGQIDSNLSTGSLVDSFEKQGIFEKHTLEKLSLYPVKILTALKGTDNESLMRNVQAETNLAEQKYSLRRFMEAGFDIYPQMYNPNPKTLEGYLTDMDSFIENFSLRVHIGLLNIDYEVPKARIKQEALQKGRDPKEYHEEKRQEYAENYQKGKEIIDSYLYERYGVRYKEVTRSDVSLKLL